MATEYNVFLVTGDHLSGPHRKKEVADDRAEKLREECPCGGADPECDDYNGLFPHGIGVRKSVNGYNVND